MKSPAEINDSRVRGRPISVGAGLVALDWLLVSGDRAQPEEVYAGGSCGNVMAILAYFGWESYPVTRLGQDTWATQLFEDLARWNVHTEFMVREERGATPVIIVRIKESKDGTLTRRYERKHPTSGEWLPRYRPVSKMMAEGIGTRLPAAKVFYFDRAEPSLLLLAKVMRERGAVVFFEPSSTKNLELFSACLGVSDIVKYSEDRLPDPPRNPVSRSPRLEIQTLGAKGLRFRIKNSNRPGPWKTIRAYSIERFRDATGCGDWCSAGIISRLCQGGRDAFLQADEEAVIDGLSFGQALAAVNCCFFGARGPMYHLLKNEVLRAALDLQLGCPVL